MIQKIIRWFEMNICWMFVNGQKQDRWNEYLQKKYGKK